MNSADGVDDEVTELADVIPLQSAIERMLDARLSPDFIAETLQIERRTIQLVLRSRNPARSPDEDVLAEEVRSLSHSVVKEARLQLEFGTAETKMQIIRSVLPNLTRSYSGEQDDTAAEARVALEQIFATSRDVPTKTQVVTDEGFIDVTTNAPALTVVNPNKKPRGPQT